MPSQTPERSNDGVVGSLIDNTRTDPDLSPVERETTIGWAADEDVARIHTEMPGLARRLLAHDGVDVTVLGVHDGEGVRTVAFDDAVANGGVDGAVVRVKARLPVGFLSIKSSERSRTQPAAVVSKRVFDE
jgi:hypothetical protein